MMVRVPIGAYTPLHGVQRAVKLEDAAYIYIYLLSLIPKKKKVEKKLPGIFRNRGKNICFFKKTYVFSKYTLLGNSIIY